MPSPASPGCLPGGPLAPSRRAWRRPARPRIHSPPPQLPPLPPVVDFLAARNSTGAPRRRRRSHRELELLRACPEASTPSTSSPCKGSGASTPSSRRNLHRDAAGPATCRRQILRPQKLPGHATTSARITVSFCFSSPSSWSPSCRVAHFAMKARGPRRHGSAPP